MNLKQKISIHPAGEWLADNYYIIEETYKGIKKELSLKQELVSINNHYYHYAIIPFLEKNKLFSFG